MYNGLSLEIYSPSDYQAKNIISAFVVLTLMYQVLADKQAYFENYHHQKGFCLENNLDHVPEVSQFYLVLCLILFLLLMLQFLYLSQNSLRN